MDDMILNWNLQYFEKYIRQIMLVLLKIIFHVFSFVKYMPVILVIALWD